LESSLLLFSGFFLCWSGVPNVPAALIFHYLFNFPGSCISRWLIHSDRRKRRSLGWPLLWSALFRRCRWRVHQWLMQLSPNADDFFCNYLDFYVDYSIFGWLRFCWAVGLFVVEDDFSYTG
jgi:hypothetical protein